MGQGKSKRYYPLVRGRSGMGLGRRSAPRKRSVLATVTPAEVTSEQLARALYSDYVGDAHIGYAFYGFMAFWFEFVL